jgi:hypothetical protein
MSTKHFLFFFLGMTSLLRAQAPAPQATPPPLGRGPLLNKAPAFASWLMSIKNGTQDSIAVPDATTKFDQRILVRKTGDTREEIYVDATGEQTDKWIVDGLQANIDPHTQEASLTGAGSGGGAAAFDPKTDFSGFEWISRSNYTGVQTMEGIPCIVFHIDPSAGDAPTPSPTPANPNAPATIPQSGDTAYIAYQGRLPVLLQQGGTTTLYQFQPAPSTPLTPPASVQDVINSLKARAQAASQAPAPP